MLPKDSRLNLKKDFKSVAAGKRIETNYLTLFIKVGENVKPQLGVALSGKNFKKAATRNRARRLTSAAFESLYSRLPKSINIVALPKVSVLSVKSGDVLLDLEGKLKDEKLIDIRN